MQLQQEYFVTFTSQITQNYLNSNRNFTQMLSKTFTLQCSVKRDQLKRMKTDQIQRELHQ